MIERLSISSVTGVLCLGDPHNDRVKRRHYLLRTLRFFVSFNLSDAFGKVNTALHMVAVSANGLSIFHQLSHLISPTIPLGRYHYYPCFTDEETNVQQVYAIYPRPHG